MSLTTASIRTMLTTSNVVLEVDLLVTVEVIITLREEEEDI